MGEQYIDPKDLGITVEAAQPEQREEKEKPKRLKILVVEDQLYPQVAILNLIHKVFGDNVGDFRNGGDILVVDNYEAARNLSQSPDFDFQIVFLDARMPAKPLARKTEDGADVSWMMDFPSESFGLVQEDLKAMGGEGVMTEAGGTLTKAFQEKGAVVIGTSSMEGVSYGDFRVSKQEPEEAEKILRQRGNDIFSTIDQRKPKK